MTAKPVSIAIIGAGFSGSLLAVHLLRRCAPAVRVHLIEKDRQFGRGLAYATGNPGHLLNVRAGRMSAFESEPAHFVRWLRSRAAVSPGIVHGPVDTDAFVPRSLFGAYIQDLLGYEIWQNGHAGSLYLVADEAVDLARDGNRMVITLQVGRSLTVDLAVLAVGNFPPETPPVADRSFYDTALYFADPWTREALADLDRRAPVLLIGTGLTMIDTVVSLLDAGHQGTIHALSRRGLLPHRHTAAPPVPPFLPAGALPTRIIDLLRLVRAEVRRQAAAGIDWRSVIDALRPLTQELWQGLPEPEKRRFLRHLRPWWEVHRHRMAPEVADWIDEARQRAQLVIHAGRLHGFTLQGKTVVAEYRKRACDRLERITAARVVNCSGPACAYASIRHPLVCSLLDQGAARPDPLRLGLEVTGDGALIGCDGTVSDRLYAIGPVTKGAFWEITAVPDIRRQCERMSVHLAERLPAPAVAP